MKWFDRLKAKIIHALGGLTRAEAMFPAPIVQVLHYDVQTVRTVKIVPAFSRTHEAEMAKMLRAEVGHNIAEYVMEHDAVVYERQEEKTTTCSSRRPSGSFSRTKGSGKYEKLRTNRDRRRNLR